MNTFISIMLIIILVLIISDVFFLWRIFKNVGKKKKQLPDEKYFELKYNINLLKAVSAILIFLVGFLGFNSYSNISENIDNDFSEKFEKQNIRIDSLLSSLSNYESIIDSLKIEEGESVKNLGEINGQFRIINNKIKSTKEALKHTTKVYVVSNLKYPKETGIVSSPEEAHTIRFETLRTIYGEKLPKFRTKPMLVLQGKSAEFTVVDLTKEYVRIEISTNISYNNKSNFFYFDMWIADPN